MHSPAPLVARIVIVVAVAAAASLAPKWGERWLPAAPSRAAVAPSSLHASGLNASSLNASSPSAAGLDLAGLSVSGGSVSGRARVLDGDSLILAGEDIRLFGIDAPESRQLCRDGAGRPYPCGRLATRALAAATVGRTVACTRLERDRYHRQVALCTADGRDLGEIMVRLGLAVELAEYSHGRYAAAEREARAARRGLWAGTFEPPAAWRHGRGW
jgi:endonuclease YncB( thermonuclease family)